MEYRVWHIQSRVRVRSTVCSRVSGISEAQCWCVVQCPTRQKWSARLWSTEYGISKVR